MNRSESGRILPTLLLVVALGGLAFLLIGALRAGPVPTIRIEPAKPGIGRRTAVRVTVEEPRRGLGAIQVELVQGERVERLAERTHDPRPSWRKWGPITASDTIEFEVGRDLQQGLIEGPATLRVIAARAGSLLRHPAPAIAERTLEVRLRPPTLEVQSSFTYVTQGGCEAVVYDVGPSAVQDGVQAGGSWFPGFPLPGGPPQRHFALFAAPYDLEDAGAIRLVARDEVGNESRAAFVDQFTRRPFGRDKIELPESFLTRVVPLILAQTPEMKDRGSLLDNYLAINRELRAANAKTLAELAGKSAPQFLWNRPFEPMRNAQVMAHFADRRTYVYQGRPVDQQDHLGIDQATVKRDRVEAGNDGVIVLARYFGIYGNAVVIDHGFGLMSLYGHLSSIDVTEGQKVARGEAIGRTGDTGLAGGDHLHFTMLLAGLPVDPREWWDGHWLHDRLQLKLGPAFPLFGA
jgi:murein DD-endopeptidase MepM/ murein hydrolase activator NlpD